MASSSSLGASSSSRSSPLARSSSKPMSSEVFKPRLPRDPFAQMPEPWNLKLDNVIAAMNAHSRRDVLLVLGAPSLRDLEPLLQSQYLGSSLLILATHQPPAILQGAAYPTVRVLRLSSPLAIEDSGAVRFVNVLESAERVARIWRKTGGTGVEELAEADLTSSSGLAPPNVFRFASSGSAPGSPQSSTERLNDLTSRPTTPTSSTNKRRLRTMSSMTFAKPQGGQRLPPVDSSQRPFDCILNFLPSHSPDKALLKQAILVTTISRPFLTAASNPTARPATTSRSSSRISIFGSSPGGSGVTEDGRRWSGILHRSSMYSSPPTPASNRSRTSVYTNYPSPGSAASIAAPFLTIPRRAHLVHLIPPTSPSVSRAKLMQSMESFLCSFAYPTALEAGQPDAAGMERAAPFLMHPYTLRTVVKYAPPSMSLAPSNTQAEEGAPEWSIADLLLSGALDRATGPAGDIVDRVTAPRAWIASANDIMFVPGSRPGSMRSVNVNMPAQPPPARQSSYTANTTASDMTIGMTHYGAWSASEPRMVSPELTSPLTHNSLSSSGSGSGMVNLTPVMPPSPSEQPIKLPIARVFAANAGLPTPPDSEESDSSDSNTPNGSTPREIDTNTVTASAGANRKRPKSLFAPGGRSFKGRKASSASDVGLPNANGKGILKHGKGWNGRWKFWKVAAVTAASA